MALRKHKKKVRRPKAAKRGGASRRRQPSRKVARKNGVKPGLSPYQQGHIAGFEQGRRDGYARGVENAKTAVAEQPPEAVLSETPATPAPAIGQLDVLVITAGHIASLDIGIVQPFRELQKRGDFSFAVHTEEEVSRELIEAAHTIIFLRNVEPSSFALLELAHALGKTTVYVIDDNFLEIPANTPVGDYYQVPERKETFRQFLTHAHIIKVDSPELGSYIEAKFKRKVVYFPASVDFAWLDGVERTSRTSGQVVIGYEGGSKEEDFVVVVPALRRILDYYGGFITLEFYGYVPAELADHPNVKHVEGNQEYRSFIRKLKQSGWDIGIAPLAVHPFNNCKTNNKLREYGACGIPGLYTDSPVYRPWIKQGETGYLVPHTEDGWYKGLREMIEDPAMRERIRVQAEAQARGEFSVEHCAAQWNQHVFRH
ncbi:glycosyltransferase [Paenibacillus daejeonensis]|uniref:glycosyltransferase n=1 Tax=Paenibacillus daejeonensis TaxID=135193 RepID=UPI0003A0DDB7|nr:glycosyltransferase [Paenibacillus daejeonensis]